MSFNSLTEDLSLNSIYPCVSEHCPGKESSFEGENWARKAWSGNLWFLEVCMSPILIYIYIYSNLFYCIRKCGSNKYFEMLVP